MIPLHQIRWHPFDLRHVVMPNWSRVAVIPINGDTVPSRFDHCTKIGRRGSPANAFANTQGSRLVAGHSCASLIGTIVIILVIVIRQPSRRSDIQFAWVEGHDRSALTRNLNKRSVIVHTTPPGRRANCFSTNRHKRKQE